MKNLLKIVLNHPPKAWGVFFVSLAVTWLAWFVSNGYVERRANEQFQFAVNDLTTSIAKRLQDQEEVLRGGAGLFVASQSVSREEWEKYAESLSLSEYYPGLQGFGYAEIVSADRLAEHTERVRADGFPEYNVRPAGVRDFYTPVTYLEPFDWRNQRAFGYDMSSEANRHKAIVRARDTGEPAMSHGVTLVQETNEDVQRGFLLYIPVYENGKPIKTIEQRRAAITGVVYSPFRMNDLMRGILGTQKQDIQFELYDGTLASPEHKLYDSIVGESHVAETGRDAGMHQQAYISFAGRTWLAIFHAREGYISWADRLQSTMIAATGLLLDIMIFWVISSVSRQQERISIKARRLSAQHRRQAETNEAIVNAVDHGIISVDGEGNILSCNTMAGRMFGYRPRYLDGLPYSLLLSEKSRLAVNGAIGSLSQLTQLAHFRNEDELTGLRRDGTAFPLELSISPLRLEGRHEFTLVFTELTERRLQDRLKQEFVATVSHELRTPLTSIRGALGLVGTGKAGQDPEMLGKLMDIARKNCTRMTVIINDILDLQKITTGHLDLSLMPVNVADIVAQAIEVNAPYATRHKVMFEKAETNADLKIMADPDRLMQVLTNLLSNAAKFSPAGSAVTIGAINNETSVEIFVRDRGIGISDDFKGRIFESFARADNTSTRKEDGTGLGLVISKKLVEAMQGSIDFVTEVGSGTTFSIRFSHLNKDKTVPEARSSDVFESAADTDDVDEVRHVRFG